MEEVTSEEVIKIIDGMIKNWRLESRSLEIAIRVHKKIGSPPELVEQLTQNLIRIEKGIDELTAERKNAEQAD